MKRLIFLMTLLSSLSVFAQSEKHLVQFSGVIYNGDSSTVVPYATITNLTTKNSSNSANYKGYFSFVVHEGDTLKVTAIGFGTQYIYIPKKVIQKSYSTEIRLKQEAVNLPVVRVFPWASSDDFRKDFLSMKVADDDLEIAKKNISRKSILEMSGSLPRDAREIHASSFGESHNNLVNQHSRTNPLLNPFAWGALIKQIDKSRQNQN
jgi:hypothetical protein